MSKQVTVIGAGPAVMLPLFMQPISEWMLH